MLLLDGASYIVLKLCDYLVEEGIQVMSILIYNDYETQKNPEYYVFNDSNSEQQISLEEDEVDECLYPFEFRDITIVEYTNIIKDRIELWGQPKEVIF